MSKANTDTVRVLGVEFDALTQEDAIAEIIRRSEPGEPAGYVVKPYVEFMTRASKDPEVRELLNAADLVLADGVSILWAAHFLYAGPRNGLRFMVSLVRIMIAPGDLAWPLPARAGGITFAKPMIEAASAAGRQVFLVGSPRRSTIEHTQAALAQHLPRLMVVGTASGTDPQSQNGRQSEAWLEQLRQRIEDSQADLVLLGLGFPRQEYAAAYLAKHLTHGLVIGEGGTFDYEWFGGVRPKAPQAMSRLGLEWLWRLMLEPQRILRQRAIPLFIWQIWRHR